MSRRVLSGALICAAISAMLAIPAEASARIEPELTSAARGELVELARHYLQDRADRLVVPARPAVRSDATALTAVPVAHELRARLAVDAVRLDQRRELLRRVDGGNARAVVRVTNPHIRAVGAVVSLGLTEQTDLYFARSRPSGITHESYAIGHAFTFARTPSGWLLKDTKPQLNGGVPPDTQFVERSSASAAPAGPPTRSASTLRPVATQRTLSAAKLAKRDVGVMYDYTAMLAYAERYWNNYNSDYRNYNGWGRGGDCTNFISQIMRAGGWADEPGERENWWNWFYGSFTWTTSYTWAGAHPWWAFANYYSRRTTFVDNVWKLYVTDVLQADWEGTMGELDHSMFITGRDGTGEYANELYLTYHTDNTHNKPLSRLLAESPGAQYTTHRT